MKKVLLAFWDKNKVVIVKWLKGACIALLGALLTYLQETIPDIDFGVWTPFIAAGNAAIVNGGRLLIAKYLV